MRGLYVTVMYDLNEEFFDRFRLGVLREFSIKVYKRTNYLNLSSEE